MQDKFLYIVDGTALIFRNYHASLSYFLNSSYHDTAALSGTITSLNSYIGKVDPTNIVVVFDPKGGSFRNEIYSEYKQNRSKPDPQLLWQIERIPELIKALGFPVLIVPGYEADDVIGTIAKYHSERGVEVLIESKDKDFVQLIDENISLADTQNDSLYDFKNGDRKFGVPIANTIDFLAICGDKIDNIPGIKGVGEKTAAGLINTYGGLEQIYQAIDEDRFTTQVGNLKPETLKKKMLASREEAFLSYKLATINTQAPVGDISLENLVMQKPDVTRVLDLLEEYELFRIRNSFIEGRLTCLACTEESLAPEVDAYLKTHTLKEAKSRTSLSKFEVKELTPELAEQILTTGKYPDGTPLVAASSRKGAGASKGATKASKSDYKPTAEDKALFANTQPFTGDFSDFKEGVVYHNLELHVEPYSQDDQVADFRQQLATSALGQALAQAQQVSIMLEKNPLHNTPVVLNILVEGGKLEKVSSKSGRSIYSERQLFSLQFAGDSRFIDKVKNDEFITPTYQAFCQAFGQQVFVPLLSQTTIPVLTANLKDLAHEFDLTIAQVNAVGTNVHDLRLVGYTRNSAIKDNSLANLASVYCALEFAPIKYLKTRVDLPAVLSTCQDSTIFMPLFYRLCHQTIASQLYTKMEQPLWKYLYTMEVNGILVDLANLEAIKADLEEQISALEEQVYALAGTKFNINSPKQTADILYNQLLLEDPTGKGSTAAETLVQLEHEIIEPLLSYRSLTTILGSHVAPLIELALANPERKIHTTFLQTQTVTGRLSSQEPNLQNVPATAGIAQRIRASFIAPPGYKMVSLDYSQIELRVSASLSQDEHMLAGFNQDEDIHARTASKIFNVPLEQVTRAQRQIAKAINFGLNYGKTAFSLSTELGISRQEASSYINEYFASYPRIKDFINQTIDKATARKFIETLEGRVIPLPLIDSSVRAVAEAEKRNATNYPIQGSAAEIIKLAMIELQKEIMTCMPEVISHLQIHDELVFSIPEALVDKYLAQIKQVMETSVSLPGVKLKVEATVGEHWSK
ncbi:DNA polymerase I [Psittacicella melopsittaci]|uniref:DNA polymerase I n=1 Tax=Psittacicella melopsittaci TaxID=2028576 RepID=A0A3A1YBK3_9GAMM|nr:DNA polymerase I [Psittacicella melopsittaci]RIY33584.1 DNA polymerase I [Psittacicella melopsittaci]